MRDLGIHAFLKDRIDPFGLLGYGFGVVDFGLHRDSEVVARISGQAEFLAVVEFK